MNLISSEYTKLYKVALPVIGLGGMGLILAACVLSSLIKKEPISMLSFAALGLLISGWVFFKSFVWKLANEVGFDGHQLLFRNKNREVIINLNQIRNIHYSGYNPPIVKINLKEETALGDQISFTPPYGGLTGMTQHPLILDLIEKSSQIRANQSH